MSLPLAIPSFVMVTDIDQQGRINLSRRTPSPLSLPRSAPRPPSSDYEFCSFFCKEGTEEIPNK